MLAGLRGQDVGLARPGTALASVPADIAAGLRKPFFLVSIMVFMFVVGAVAFSRVPGVFVISKVLGAILAVFFLVDSIRAGFALSAEVVLYVVWLVWCLAGLFSGAIPRVFLTYWTSAFQIWVLMLIISNFTMRRGGVSLVLLAFLIAVAISGTASVLSGSFASGTPEERLTGLSRNANGFGRLMVYATFCMMYFWMLPTRSPMLGRGVLVVGMVLAAALTMLSGSRFSVLGLGLLYVLWLWYSYRETVRRNPRLFLKILLLAVIGGAAFVLYAQRSVVGGRLVATWDTLVTGTRTESSTLTRLKFYKIGFDYFKKSPLVGIGLGTFYAQVGQPAHSDLVEVAVGSGLPGIILYYAIYLVAWRRAEKAYKHTREIWVLQTAGLIRAAIVVVVFLGLGGPNYYSKEVWILMGTCIGYTLVAWAHVRSAEAAVPARATARAPVLPA